VDRIRADRRIFRDASRRRGIAGRGGVFGAASPRRGLRSTSTRDQNISSTVEGLGLLVTEARAWLSSWSVRSVHCSRTGSGHMGATPQPKRTIASEGNQHWSFRKSGISNVSGSNQRPAESIDTVGVTGSIPVSPTTMHHDTRRVRTTWHGMTPASAAGMSTMSTRSHRGLVDIGPNWLEIGRGYRTAAVAIGSITRGDRLRTVAGSCGASGPGR
jgi:hypothetical protein